MLLLLLPLILFILWKPFIGSIIYLIIYGLFILWILLANNSGKIKVKNDKNKFTYEEVKVIEKYQLFFQYPFVCRSLSALFSGFQLAVFLLSPYLLYRGIWIPAIIIGISYFISPQFAITLNPQFFLHDNLDKGRVKQDNELYNQYKNEMEAIDSALEILYLKK